MDTATKAAMAHQASLAAAEKRRALRFDQYEDLLACGYDPETAARRLGVTAMSLARQAYRHGRSDIARPLGALDKRRRDALRRRK